MSWLLASLVLSIVLTVVLNVALRAFPGSGDRLARRVDDYATRYPTERYDNGPRVRVFAPWKAMLVASIVLTIVLNVAIRLM